MNWDAAGAIGELVGALAVVITLGYLALQIRQSNRATRSASIQEYATAMNAINGWGVNDASVARVWRTGCQSFDALSEDDATRFSQMMLAIFHVFETMFLQNAVGTIEASVWEAEIRSLRALLDQPGCRDWWKDNPYALTTEFRAFVDALHPPLPA